MIILASVCLERPLAGNNGSYELFLSSGIIIVLETVLVFRNDNEVVHPKMALSLSLYFNF